MARPVSVRAEVVLKAHNTHFFLALFALGCGEASNFNNDYADLVCDKLSTCAPGAVETGFGDEYACSQDVRERMDSQRDDPTCSFDTFAAQDCLSQTQGLSCETWLMYGEPDACEQAYECSEGDAFEYLSDDTGL